MFLNIKLVAISVIIGAIWVLVFVVFIWPFLIQSSGVWLRNFSLIFCVGTATLGGLLVFCVVGVIGKIVYSKKIIKCKQCKSVNRADKYFCGSCGERLLDDEWIKLSSSHTD